MKKALLFVFAAVAAVCLSFSVFTITSGANIVRAETVTGITPTLSSTKYLKSTDGTTLLLATGIKDYDDCYELGYITTGADAIAYDTAKYYTSISLKNGAKVWTTEDLFPGYTGMIVWEVRCTACATSFKPYVKVGDREDGVLVESDTIVYGTEKEVVTHATALAINASYIHATDFTMENFRNSGKALTFEYKAIADEGNSANDIQFTIWTYEWSPRITELVSIDIINDVVGGDIGKIEDINDGWRRVTINCADIPIANGATGNETAGLLYFNIVNHAFLFDNVGFVDEDVHIGAPSFTANTAKDYYFGDSPSTSGVTLDNTIVLDVKFTSTGDFNFYLNEYWFGRWCGPFTLTSSGAFSGNGAISSEDIGDGWYRIKIKLGSANKSNPVPAFVSRVNILNTTTANGFVKYIGYEEPEEAEPVIYTPQAGDYIDLPETITNYTTSSKYLTFKIKPEDPASSGTIQIKLSDGSAMSYGIRIVFNSNSAPTNGRACSSIEDIGDGWYLITTQTGAQITGSAFDATKLKFEQYSGYPAFSIKDLQVN